MGHIVSKCGRFILASNAHYFYVLYCNDNTLYGGYTTDLMKRLNQHQQFKGAKFTKIKAKHPLKLIYAEKWSSKSLAMSQEYYFKRLTRTQKEHYLAQFGVNDVTQQSFILNNREVHLNDSTTKLP